MRFDVRHSGWCVQSWHQMREECTCGALPLGASVAIVAIIRVATALAAAEQRGYRRGASNFVGGMT